MITRVGDLFNCLAGIGVLPGDPPEVRLRKAVLTLAAVIISVLAVYWVGMYLALGLRVSAAIPFIYQVVSAAGLIHFLRAKDDRLFRTSQLTAMLLLPFLLQWSLGGFVNSSGVMLWAFLSPLGATLIGGLPHAGRMGRPARRVCC